MSEIRPTEQFNDVIYGSYFKDDVENKYYQRSRAGVYFSDSPNLDSFGRLRVSVPHTIFDATLYTGISTMSYDTSTASGGTVTHDSNKKAAILSATSTTGSTAILQTRQYLKYNPAKSALLTATGNFKGSAANVTKRLGQFDANNGFYFEVSGTAFSVNIRSKISGSVVNTSVAQSSWNLDRMDGSGGTTNPSGVTVDTSKQLIFMITYQWLGSGRVVFALNIDGKIIPVHQFLGSNVNTTMYSQTATLPLRYEIVNSGSTASTMEVSCMCYMTEGDGDGTVIGTPYSVSTGVTTRNLAGSGANFPLISIRKKSAFSEIPLKLYEAFLMLASADQVLVQAVFNPTLTGASFVSAPSGNAEYDVSATTTGGTGTVIHSHYLDGGSGMNSLDISAAFNDTSLMTLGQSIAGVSDIVSIVVSNITTNTTLLGGFNYKELVI